MAGAEHSDPDTADNGGTGTIFATTVDKINFYTARRQDIIYTHRASKFGTIRPSPRGEKAG